MVNLRSCKAQRVEIYLGFGKSIRLWVECLADVEDVIA